MSNLGGYQKVTTLLKRLGGPKIAITIILGGTAAVGTALGSLGTLAIQKLTNSSKKANKEIAKKGPFIILEDGESNEGLKLSRGQKYYVLERDDDAVLIELENENNNPYFVSYELLKKVSNIKEYE